MKKTSLALLVSGMMSLTSCGLINNIRQNNSLLSAYLSMCRDDNYDYDARCITSKKNIEIMANSAYIFENQVKYDFPKSEEKEFKYLLNKYIGKIEDDYVVYKECTTILLNKEGYMLTTKDCIKKPEPLYCVKTLSSKLLIKESSKDMTNKEFKRSLKIYPLEQKSIVKINKINYEVDVLEQSNDEAGVVLLKVKHFPKNKIIPNFDKANFNKINVGQLIYQVENKNNNIQLTKGIVSKTNNNNFMINTGLEFEENLGSPVYLIKDGVPELAGMLTKSDEENRIVLSIDEIVKSLKLKEKGLL